MRNNEFLNTNISFLLKNLTTLMQMHKKPYILQKVTTYFLPKCITLSLIPIEIPKSVKLRAPSVYSPSQ